MALPKGRILGEARPVLERAGVMPEAEFDDSASRKLKFQTQDGALELVLVRAFDVATVVAFGGAHMGIAGSDVLMEFGYSEIYAPLDLGIGRCRMMVAEPADKVDGDDPRRWSHVRVATKYPEITSRHFAARGVQAECIKLSGSMELAPSLGLCRRIVDLVSTGATLKANGLVEVEQICNVSSRLVVNRAALKTRPQEIGGWLDRFAAAVNGEAGNGD
jgi:ATP phosphoribosyltransferase